MRAGCSGAENPRCRHILIPLLRCRQYDAGTKAKAMSIRKRKTTHTTTVAREVVVIKTPTTPDKDALCVECAGLVRMFTLEEAVHMTNISSRGIFRLIEEGRIHFLETDKGLVLICPA